jgi:hypothetical protein
MTIGYNKECDIGGQFTLKNCMPICKTCNTDKQGYNFKDYKAMKKVVVPLRCYKCRGFDFKYIYKCCGIRMCDECVKNDERYLDFATLFCPFETDGKMCGIEVSMTSAMIY